MNPNWLQDRQREFEEMEFRQKADELPISFFQQRIRVNSFLYPNDQDGPAAVARILLKQPPDWGAHISAHTAPTLFELQAIAQRMETSLVSSWVLAERMNRRPDSRSYHDSHRPRAYGERRSFPHGKAINGNTFDRRDNVVSIRPLNGECFICSSPKHIFRDCPHHGKLTALGDSNVITNPVEEDAANRTTDAIKFFFRVRQIGHR